MTEFKLKVYINNLQQYCSYPLPKEPQNPNFLQQLNLQLRLSFKQIKTYHD